MLVARAVRVTHVAFGPPPVDLVPMARVSSGSEALTRSAPAVLRLQPFGAAPSSSTLQRSTASRKLRTGWSPHAVEDDAGEWPDCSRFASTVDDDTETYFARRVVPRSFRPRAVPEPAGTDPATMRAILAAFGSTAVRERYGFWRLTLTEIEDEQNTLRWNWDQEGDPEARITLEEQASLQNELGPRELRQRQALADAVAAKLRKE